MGASAAEHEAPTATSPGDHHGDQQPAPHGAHENHGGGHDHGGPLVHRFDEADQWAARFDRPERDATQRPAAVVSAMGLTPGMTVADIGTGTGYFLPHLSPAVGPSGRVLAIDIEPSMVRYVRERAEREKLSNVEPRLALVDDPLLGEATADRVLVVNTWHHIPERASYVRRVVRGLKGGGAVWVIDYKLDAPDGPPAEHRLPPAKVVEELESGGLSCRVDDSLLPHQYIVVGTKAVPR